MPQEKEKKQFAVIGILSNSLFAALNWTPPGSNIALILKGSKVF